jgi:hypothetical protein
MDQKTRHARVNVNFNYVLVIEWLNEGDQPTGAQLHHFLGEIGFRSVLLGCNSAEGISDALADAVGAVPTHGIPVVHLESHGTDPSQVDANELCFGAGAGPGVTWQQLGDWLAPLNAASDFRLLCVSAACWGSGVMGGIGGGEHVAPFACAVGFRTSVDEGRLRDAMREFYRRLMAGDQLNESVESAQRELVKDQKISLEVALELGVKILQQAYYRSETAKETTLGPIRRRRRARASWDEWFPPSLQERDPAYRFEMAGIEPRRVR